jgi:raffinose/stachyose/melibiose transport system substrate-binding protein
MRLLHSWFVGALVVACVALVAACGGSSDSESTTSGSSAAATETGGGAESATLELWAGGLLSSATPGSSARKWLDDQIERFKQDHPGSDVKVTLLPVELNALAAKVQAAFASGEVPDVMTLWSGNLTEPYADGLLRLNDLIDATPGYYDGISDWALSCVDYDCQDGQGDIIGVPIEAGGYFLFYNKELFQQAGITDPPTTYDELYADCATLRSKNILPIAWGAKDGYQTSNTFTPNLVSTLEEGDIQRLLSGEMKYTDERVVSALEAVVQMSPEDKNCMDRVAYTKDALTGAKDFLAGKAAMTTLYGILLGDMKKALGDKLGVARLPVSGDGPLLDVGSGYAANSFANWVIPKDSSHQDLTWEFVQTVTDKTAGIGILTDLGETPANKAAAATITDPIDKFLADLVVDPPIVNLDQVMPEAVALFMYKQLELAFQGKQSAADTMQKVQDFSDSEGAG